MISQHNFKNVLIGKDVDRTSDVTPGTLAEGEIAGFTPAGTLITSSNAADVDKMVIFQGTASGDPIQISDVIRKDEVIYCKGVNGAAAQQQIDVIGFDGSSGALDTTNDNLFYIRMYLQELLVSNSDGREVKVAVYKSPTSGTTQALVANTLRKSLIDNFSREAQELIKADVLIDNAGAAVGAAADTVVGTKGSKTITVTDVGSNDSVTAIAAGDFFRVGTALTDPVYKVVASTVGTGGGVLTLDVPLQEDVNLVGNTSEFITAANAASADCGIKITGVALSSTVGKFQPSVLTWETVLEGFDTATVTTTQASDRGVNTGALVAEAEHFFQGNSGETFRDYPTAHPPKAYADASILYDSINIAWNAKEAVGSINVVPRKELQVFIPATRSNDQYSASTSGIEDSFEAFFGVTLGL